MFTRLTNALTKTGALTSWPYVIAHKFFNMTVMELLQTPGAGVIGSEAFCAFCGVGGQPGCLLDIMINYSSFLPFFTLLLT